MGYRFNPKIDLVGSRAAAPNSQRDKQEGSSMLDMVGEAVDRLITIEAKNHGMPHGVLQQMYDAARKAAGNKPLTMTAARGLAKALGKGDVVFILTGAGYEPTMPKGESDGPPGAASLARILYRGLGAIPVFVNEECHADPIIASSEAAGLMIKPFAQAREELLPVRRRHWARAHGRARLRGGAKYPSSSGTDALSASRTTGKAAIAIESPALDANAFARCICRDEVVREGVVPVVFALRGQAIGKIRTDGLRWGDPLRLD